MRRRGILAAGTLVLALSLVGFLAASDFHRAFAPVVLVAPLPPPTATSTPTLTPPPTPTAGSPTATPTKQSTATPTRGAPSGCSTCAFDAYNCSDFDTQAEAQACFDYCWDQVGFDVHNLDSDEDGEACEALPRVWEWVLTRND